MKAMDALDRAALRRLAQAKEALAAIIESIVLTPGPDGYAAKLTLKNRTAAPGSGLFVQTVAGARWTSFLLPQMPCIHADSAPPAPAPSPVVPTLYMVPGYATDTGSNSVAGYR